MLSTQMGTEMTLNANEAFQRLEWITKEKNNQDNESAFFF